MLQDMKESMASNLIDIRQELNRAQEEADEATKRVEDLERQESALQSALDILEGRTPTAAPAPKIPQYTTGQHSVIQMPSIQGEKVTLNGEEIILEPGMRIGKNSYGEDVLMPDGVPDPPLLGEPIVPLRNSVNLPPITSDDKFDDPKDML
jgi:hypothetical protein